MIIEEYKDNINNNLVIESENLIVLKELSESDPGSVDVIAIDPPYNTEIDYINYKDSNFEGGWKAFMKERLTLSKKILSPTGVMFINIDENELVNSLNICYDLFGINNVNILIWPKVDLAFDENRIEKPIHNVRLTHEYVILCYMNKMNTHFKNTSEGKPLESILSGYGTTSSAKDEICSILGSRSCFSTPKPVKLLKELIRVASRKDSTILDFFAGSGTTGHAVMELNEEDGGCRRFILITNNESDICRKITVPRLKGVIEKGDYNSGFTFISKSEL